ncbi:tudor domain-containing protein 5-like isoform x2 [Plakobranchus ocellatus]|uniref:Tudor domain-containing protein 5-like isoform x2 n=1 Tax=Plakobranchus ocellatus TaxID=259542 RepID=A0AAV3WR61_9GAST|nr:tudor domain-containing protein 5-like isoform x2 [Plakobranchus ocellatus]
MEIKRKRILSRMLSESPTADCVNELNTVELHISRVEALITKLESESVGSGSSASSSGKQVVENHPHSLQSTNPNPISTGKNPTQTTKTTHKVAPMVQASPVPPQQASQTSVMLAQKNAGELNPPPLVPAMDLTALLQQQMLMNEMMMQQFGLSTRNASYPGQLSTPSVTPSFPTPAEGSAAQMLHGYGRGIPTAEQQQLQQLQMLQNQLMTGPGVSSAIPGLGENPLSQQQRELEAINLRLSALGMMPPATSGHPGSIPSFATAGQNMSSPSVPPGLMPSGMLGLPGVGRGKPAVGTFGSQPAGLQAMLQQQQQQPNFAFSALHQQQHSQRPQ